MSGAKHPQLVDVKRSEHQLTNHSIQINPSAEGKNVSGEELKLMSMLFSSL